MHFNQLKKAKKILIYGYGAEGKSSEKFLRHFFPEASLQIFDEQIPTYTGESFNQNYDLIVVSPGVARSEKIPEEFWNRCTSNTEIFFHNISPDQRKKIIGISGTKGKSTTSGFCLEMLHHAGKTARVAGNFGVPLLEVYEEFISGKIEYLVVELSSFQLEHLDVSPGISIFLNLFPDHLDRHRTIEVYFKAKKNLWAHQEKEDFLILCESMRLFYFSGKLGTINSQVSVASSIEKDVFAGDSVFRATHFRENFGTMIQLSEILDLPERSFLQTVHSFQGLPHRMEFFVQKHDIRFYDDAIAVNPDSVRAAVDFFGEELGMLILGGKSGGGSFQTLFEKVKPLSNTKIIVLESEAGKEILSEIKKQKFPENRFFVVKNLEEAVPLIFMNTVKDKVCLLSPGAKSYDQFKNFQEKGNHFKALIKQYE